MTVAALNETELDFLNSGCTLNAVVIMGDCVFSCNIGDSRAVIIKNKEVVQLSVDHRLDLPTAKTRIELKMGFSKKRPEIQKLERIC